MRLKRKVNYLDLAPRIVDNAYSKKMMDLGGRIKVNSLYNNYNYILFERMIHVHVSYLLPISVNEDGGNHHYQQNKD